MSPLTNRTCALFILLIFSFGSHEVLGQWTDSTLTPKITTVKATHITELRTQINTKLLACGESPHAWTRSQLHPKITTVQKIDLDELRAATTRLVNASRAHNALPPQAPIYTDSTIVAKVTPIKALHIQEIRDYVDGSNCAPGCPAQVLSWNVGANGCSAPAPATAVGSLAAVSDNSPPRTGSAQFNCGAGGVWAASPNAGATCVNGGGCTLGNGTSIMTPYGRCWTSFTLTAMGMDCRQTWPDCGTWVAHPSQASCSNAFTAPLPVCSPLNPIGASCHLSAGYCKSPAAVPAGSCNITLCE